MATIYNREEAITRARTRANQDNDGYNVYRHRWSEHDFIVRNTSAAHPRDFVLVVTIQPDETEES